MSFAFDLENGRSRVLHGNRQVRSVTELIELTFSIRDNAANQATGLMPFADAALTRRLLEAIEATERAHGDLYIPGLSNKISSRMAYRGVLRRQA
jgi:hypothetical protein